MRPRLALTLVLLLVAAALSASAQTYTAILVFGDSLSDTGNVAHLTQSQFLLRIPGPVANYTDGRFTDGTDTRPAATAFTGIWIEQLASMLPNHPAVLNSLDGGTNYAFGYARTGSGTSSLQLTTGVAVNVDNIGQQILDYRATHATVPANTLVVVWGGANDLLNATSAGDVSAAAQAELADIQALIALGATDFLIPNLPPLGAIPRLNTTGNATTATAAAQLFNSTLAAGLAQLPAANRSTTLRLYPLDVYTLFNAIIASPSASNLANVTLASQAQSVNPDTYLFWDDLHPTTTGHHLIALAASSRLNTPLSIVTGTTLTGTGGIPGTSTQASFTATVTAASGTTAPSGTVTFLDGTTTLGSATLAASTGLASTATLSLAPLTVGAHSITAVYAGGSSFAGSNSTALALTVQQPGITLSTNPSTLTVTAGATGTSSLAVTPVNGFSGAVTLACTGAPANSTCTVAAPPATISSAQTLTVTVTTNGTATQSAGLLPLPLSGPGAVAGLTVLSALFGLSRARRRGTPGSLLTLLIAASSLAVLGLAGCGSSSSSHTAARGTYPLTLTATPAASTGAAAASTTLTLVVQ